MSAIASRRHRKRKLKAEINVVPYIDVMLVLLIIFMVTAPLLNLGVDIELPQSNAKSMQEKKDPVIVSVDPAGNYFLTVEAGSNEAVTRDTLLAKMRAIVNQNPQVPVFVAGDGSANYQKVMDAMVLLQEAGVERVGLMSQPNGEGGE
ncbi:MAG: protein TolR [Lysobacterales bacterium RIFOXYD1_FULL_69_11]|uniref:Tol-Pal system protein TolR n=1 Tax=Novilysobacter selenitireducens TaxID=2872639 RepID=A0ABS7T3S7_9GAMM|nr:protein TolR [Lysobacter selenitireducens]MBZ4038523.1 protein TolR [Lysobacter selenitireducens]OHE84413.1 MAG: protein TolR [Xanthomonadales bacterium RIFOXYA1_FULL_69_10]OHE87828.1 MAG: protein TolR [Xanthomonadales bacterium RIFOXYD1_FULL_69_11]